MHYYTYTIQPIGTKLWEVVMYTSGKVSVMFVVVFLCKINSQYCVGGWVGVSVRECVCCVMGVLHTAIFRAFLGFILVIEL